MNNLFILDLEKGFVKSVGDFVRINKEKMKRNQMFGPNMKRLKIKIIGSKGKEYEVGLFD